MLFDANESISDCTLPAIKDAADLVTQGSLPGERHGTVKKCVGKVF